MLAVGALAALAPSSSAVAQSGSAPISAEDLKFFESKIRPVLIEQCYQCHSNRTARPKARLLLDTREGMLRGGSTGPAIVPGDPEHSLLIQMLRSSDPDVAMPPDKPLPESVIADFERWIARGAPDPRETPTARTTDAKDSSAGGAGQPALELPASKDDGAYAGVGHKDPKEHWAFKPIIKPAPPTVTNESWPRTDLDRFVLAALDAKGLKPVGDADRRTLLRRLSFDLTGLPPAPEALDAFEKDTRADALERAVDALLASPAFGERWGRHWLDVARYAESSGKETNVLYPHAWRYRDYVIRALNADTPFDRFVMEQIAGDVIVAEDDQERAWNLAATGYLAVGSKGHNTRGRQQFAMDLADEQIDAVTQGIMGLTVACARCHDHKFDPIPQRDYYAMAGIFLSSNTHFGGIRGPGNQHVSELVMLPTTADVPAGGTMGPLQRTAIQAALERATREAEALGSRQEIAQRARSGNEQARLQFVRLQRFEATARTAKEALDRFDAQGHPTAMNLVAMGMTEGQPTDARLLERGEIDRAGERVSRGVVTALGVEMPSIPEGSGRLELAQWLVSRENPLTARVLANRVWLHLFGKAIVPTPDNFGMAGLPPSNPALLDHLAVRLMELDWSVKSLIREVVLSHAYALSTEPNEANHAIDPENTLTWRMNRKRLEAEAIRDSMLAVSGRLDVHSPAGSIVNALEGDLRNPGIMALLEQPMPPVRSVYLPVVRDHIPESLEVFDFPDPNFVTGQRERTSVPTQALLLLNDGEVGVSARALAERLVDARETDPERITLAFQLLYGRRASASEQQAVKDFLRDFASAQRKGGSEAANGRNSTDAGVPGARFQQGQGGGMRDAVARRRGQRQRPGAEGAPPTETAPLGTASADAWTAACRALFANTEFRTLD